MNKTITPRLNDIVTLRDGTAGEVANLESIVPEEDETKDRHITYRITLTKADNDSQEVFTIDVDHETLRAADFNKDIVMISKFAVDKENKVVSIPKWEREESRIESLGYVLTYREGSHFKYERGIDELIVNLDQGILKQTLSGEAVSITLEEIYALFGMAATIPLHELSTEEEV